MACTYVYLLEFYLNREHSQIIKMGNKLAEGDLCMFSRTEGSTKRSP